MSEHAYWHERWREHRIGFHRPVVHEALLRFWPTLVQADARVLVPLSGKSRDLVWLESRGHEVVAAELVEQAVVDFHREHTRPIEVTDCPPFRIYRSRAITTFCGDFFALDPAHTSAVTAIYDRAALIALPPARRVEYARQLLRWWAPGLSAVLVTCEYPQELRAGPPYSVEAAEVHAHFGGHFHIELLHSTDLLAADPDHYREFKLPHMREQIYGLRAPTTP
ncbi:MAG: thiopurine S-methyltransferase [Planctomycetota bacterium]